MRRLRQLLADITFLEAYERTNRFLNVTVTAADTNEPPRMLNYLTAPHVVIWSAVACSSAFPGLFPAQELLARDSNGKFVKCVMHLSFFGVLSESFAIMSLAVLSSSFSGVTYDPVDFRLPRTRNVSELQAGLLRQLLEGSSDDGMMAALRMICRSGSCQKCSMSTISLSVKQIHTWCRSCLSRKFSPPPSSTCFKLKSSMPFFRYRIFHKFKHMCCVN